MRYVEQTERERPLQKYARGSSHYLRDDVDPAISGSIRFVTRKPRVTAGLKWPDMRISALTITAG
jgi:hypothetical protein